MYCCRVFSFFYVLCQVNLPLMLCVKIACCEKFCCVSKPPCSVSITLPDNVLVSVNVSVL